MTDRNELARLFAKEEVRKIGKKLPEDQRVAITFRPLSAEDMKLMQSDSNLPEDERSIQLVEKCTDLKVDEIKRLAVPFLAEIFDVIADINNVADDETLQKLKDAALNKAIAKI